MSNKISYNALDWEEAKQAIRSRQRELGMSQSKVAEAMSSLTGEKIKQANISAWLNQNTPLATKLPAFLHVLRLRLDGTNIVPDDAPLSRVGEPGVGYGALPVEVGPKSKALEKHFVESYTLDIYPNVAASAGDGCVVWDPQTRIRITVPKHFMRMLLGFNPPDRILAIFVKGRSMAPLYDDGDMIIVDPEDVSMVEGRYVLLYGRNGSAELIAKKVKPLLGGGYRIISENKLEGYPDEVLVEDAAGAVRNKDTGAAVEIEPVGRVLWPRSLPDRFKMDEVVTLFKSLMNAGTHIE